MTKKSVFRHSSFDIRHFEMDGKTEPMNFNWQELVAAAVVLVAAGYLAYQGWRVLFAGRTDGCGGSCSCPGKEPPEGKPLVPLDITRSSPKGYDMKAQGNALGSHERLKPEP
jgi:hypothetical protein